MKEDLRKEETNTSIVDINYMADKGTSTMCSMGSLKKMPFSLADLHFVPAQIFKIPINRTEEVNVEVIIGPEAKKPLKVFSPIMLGGMSYGTVSKNVRLVLAEVAANLRIGVNSGEDFVLPEELNIASRHLILQFATGRYGFTDELLKKAAAVEIRFGQGAYPGWQGVLPAGKVSQEVAKLMGINENEDAYSPAHHPDIRSKDELKEKITSLRMLTDGVPIGAKIGCGDVENDVKILAEGGVDFIALDGFGGGTGATESFVRENVGVPIVVALPRAVRQLKNMKASDKISLIAGGGLRTSADFAKCLALGANAVYIGTSALIAINCKQYRICHTGHCPTGVTTNDPVLLKRLDIKEGVRRLTNFINVSTQEIADFTRIVGKDDVKKLSSDDLAALNRDLAEITGVSWLSGKNI